MKFLSDMVLAVSTARYLRDCGHDAVHLREQGLPPTRVAWRPPRTGRAGGLHKKHAGYAGVRVFPTLLAAPPA
jgi:hypothetical protein